MKTVGGVSRQAMEAVATYGTGSQTIRSFSCSLLKRLERRFVSNTRLGAGDSESWAEALSAV